MATSLLLLVCAPYAAVAVGYVEARRRGERPPGWARGLGLLTIAAHLAGLVALGAETHRSPFRTESEALSFLAFSLAGLYGLLEATSRVATFGGRFYLSTAILAGGLLAAAYLGVYRRVKGHRLAFDAAPDAGEGPSLFGLERLARHASVTGIMLLGPSLVLGGVVLERGADAGTGTALLAVSGLQFAMVFAAAFLWWRRPRRGATAAWLNVAATGVAILAFGVVHPLIAKGG